MQDRFQPGEGWAILLVPRKVFFTKSVGIHREELRSFELALRGAGIEKCTSSRYPASCRQGAVSYPAMKD